MSKSDPSDQSRINLTLTMRTPSPPRSAKHAPTSEPLPQTPEAWRAGPRPDNLVGISRCPAARPKAQVLKTFGGQGFGQSCASRR